MQWRNYGGGGGTRASPHYSEFWKYRSPFELRSTGRLSASTRSNRRSSGEASKTMDYKSVFTNLCLERQQNRSWIKGLGKRVNSFIDGSAFCPGAPKRVPSDTEKHRRVYTSSNVCHSHEWRVDTASGKTLKKTECRVYTLSDRRSEKKLRV